MNKEQKLFWAGVSVIIITHVYMLVYGMPTNQIKPHAIINLIAIIIIAQIKR